MNSGLAVSVLEDKKIGNCSLNGISARFSELYLVPNELFPNIPKIFNAHIDEQYVEIKVKHICDEPYYYVVKKYPSENEKKCAGPMFGGSFIYTSDSRFPLKYPVPLHDRYESWEMYESMSK